MVLLTAPLCWKSVSGIEWVEFSIPSLAKQRQSAKIDFNKLFLSKTLICFQSSLLSTASPTNKCSLQISSNSWQKQLVKWFLWSRFSTRLFMVPSEKVKTRISSRTFFFFSCFDFVGSGDHFHFINSEFRSFLSLDNDSHSCRVATSKCWNQDSNLKPSTADIQVPCYFTLLFSSPFCSFQFLLSWICLFFFSLWGSLSLLWSFRVARSVTSSCMSLFFFSTSRVSFDLLIFQTWREKRKREFLWLHARSAFRRLLTFKLRHFDFLLLAINPTLVTSKHPQSCQYILTHSQVLWSRNEAHSSRRCSILSLPNCTICSNSTRITSRRYHW